MAIFKLKNLQDGSEIEIDKDTFTLGREEDCDVVLNQGYPSRMHAQIIMKDGELLLDDLNSTNGTFINNNRVRSSTRIKPGDVLKFATSEFRVMNADQSDQTIIQKPASKDSYFVVEEDIDPDQTALRQQYPLPAGWPAESTQTRANFFAQGKEEKKDELKKINQIIEKALASTQDEIYVAAVVFKSEDIAPIVYGIKLDSDTSRWTIGRKQECSFTVDLPSVSEHHADIVFLKGKWIIRDNNSTNGLRQDNQLKEQIELKNGSKVSLGQIDMFFRELKWSI